MFARTGPGVLPGVFATKATAPTLRAVPTPLFRDNEGAFEEVEELAEDGRFPSTESSSSKCLSTKQAQHKIHKSCLEPSPSLKQVCSANVNK